jgi:signal transduction histidine kinase
MMAAEPGSPSDQRASPLALAALACIGERTTVADLEHRLADLGADLRPDVARALLAELASLGLVRIARGMGEARDYVLTSLGHRVIEHGITTAGAVPLAELERLRTDLLSTIAHEVRTPLTAIRTSVGLLLDPSARPTADQQHAMLQTIERNAQRIRRLVDDILELARFRSGSVTLQQRRFDAVTMAGSAIAAIEPLAEQRGQRLELLSSGADRPTLFGDHRRLEQALINLVSNAQRFSVEGGHIVVRVQAGDGRVRWSVTDDGPGISPEDQARLFERFFVGRTDRHAPREGIGLGLPTALAIAQAHGGTIEVRSERGRGSTFSLVVPADADHDED